MRFFKNRKFRFLIAGIGNTAFGYFSTIILFFMLGDAIDLFYLALIASFFNILLSSLVQKVFVFTSKSIVPSADLQVISYYTFMAIITSFILSKMVLILGISIWLSQAVLVILSAFVSYNYFKFLYKNHETNINCNPDL